ISPFSSRVMSCFTTSATRRSRRDCDAVRSAVRAASSHDSVLVPTISLTMYTLPSATGSLLVRYVTNTLPAYPRAPGGWLASRRREGSSGALEGLVEVRDQVVGVLQAHREADDRVGDAGRRARLR